jgi:hypothetical protein
LARFTPAGGGGGAAPWKLEPKANAVDCCWADRLCGPPLLCVGFFGIRGGSLGAAYSVCGNAVLRCSSALDLGAWDIVDQTEER